MKANNSCFIAKKIFKNEFKMCKNKIYKSRGKVVDLFIQTALLNYFKAKIVFLF